MHRQYSLAKKLPALVLSACLIFGLFGWALLSSYASQLSQETLQEKGDLTINQLVELVRGPLFNGDSISIQVALQNVTEDRIILDASVYDIGGQLIAQSKKPAPETSIPISFSRNIALQETQAGKVLISIDSRAIQQRHSQVVSNWLMLWAVFTLLSSYGCFRFAEQLSRRLRMLTNRLPGSSESLDDEMASLELRLQPLLSKSSDEGLSDTGYYCSLITATIKNRHRLESQLNRQNLTQLFEKIDYCTLRTLELYAGQRIEGGSGSINFYIRSTQVSKQHLLICLMAIYSLQQVLERLSEELGIDLDICWALCSDNIPSAPLFRHHEGLDKLKSATASLADDLDKGAIAVQSAEFDIEQLSSIARFLPFKENCFVLQGFPEGRQMLLEKQIQHLATICL
ncbi:MAG: hypothetical protein HOM20_06280 [Porticoccaceae bacterium]|jgi:uncharacterized membrane protein affecting hemolysin expression|nr:hypothetical protein [Porticoccaceae bacterium]MBT6115201.1 hypothetical protein [Porticoccaceae bacterium]MDC0589360.1 YtjB family periplasmic protein [Porticoccaceae bacterium]